MKGVWLHGVLIASLASVTLPAVAEEDCGRWAAEMLEDEGGPVLSKAPPDHLAQGSRRREGGRVRGQCGKGGHGALVKPDARVEQPVHHVGQQAG